MKKKKIELSLVTVNYGTSEKIQKLFDSLKKYAGNIEWEWIIVDNNSAHNDAEKIEHCIAQESSIHLLKLQENIGFGKANDEAVRFAQGEYIGFINPDIQIQPNCLEELLSFLVHHSRVGIITPALQSPQGNFLENTWDFPTFWSLIKKRLFARKQKKVPTSDPHSVAWAQGSFLIISQKLFRKLGGFDPRFFLFFEDTDLCRRCWEAGHQVVQIPTARAFHSEHRLSGKDIFRSFLRKTFWIHVLSMIQYFWKWRGKKKPNIF
ncbi:glycosyltransferase family 2 protein [Candidatus Gracilibacteria bacterium]|nr:glycosyltransferase family 2 protein [Candidatus Gracilibacteria bacterium]MCF7819324.1 glycosyltransferase family 2 protein [Candidatus Gracilibacteria bacterium]